jgi:hypothetical protein
MIQVQQAEKYWTRGTKGTYDIFPKSLEPAACTAASKAKEKIAFKERWQEDTVKVQTARFTWDNLHSLYTRTDIFAQSDLRDRLSNTKLGHTGSVRIRSAERDSDDGDGDDKNPFAALCSSGMLDECISEPQMDSATTAASLDANEYLQCDVDSLCEATLLSIRSDAPVAKSVTVRFVTVYSTWHLQCFDTTRAFLWDLTVVIFMRRPPPLPPSLCRLVMWIHQAMYVDSLLADDMVSTVASNAVVMPMDPSHPLGHEKLMRTWSQDGSRTRKLTERVKGQNSEKKIEAEKTHLAKVQEAAARRGGVGGGTSDAGGQEDENPFMALADDYLQCDIDGLCEATLFSMRPYADCLKRSVIHDNDDASNSLNLLPDVPPHLSPSPPAPVWDTSAISPSGRQWLLPPSTPAAAVVVSLAIGATASVGITFGVERTTRHADDYFQLGAKFRKCCFIIMGYPPGQRGYRVRSITTNRFFMSGSFIFDENYSSIHSILTQSTHDYSTLLFLDQSGSDFPAAPEPPINPANLDNLDTTATLQPPQLDVEPSHSLESSPAPRFSYLQIAPSTPGAARTRSQDGSRMWKLTEKGQNFETKIEVEKARLEKVREAAARRGGEGDDDPFMALCVRTDSADIDSLCKATLLSIRGDI